MNSEWVFARCQFTTLRRRISFLLLGCACFIANLTTADAGMISINESVSSDRDLRYQFDDQSLIETLIYRFRSTELIWTDSVNPYWNQSSTTAAAERVAAQRSRFAHAEPVQPNPAEVWRSQFEPGSIEENLFGMQGLMFAECGSNGPSVPTGTGGHGVAQAMFFNHGQELHAGVLLGRLAQHDLCDFPSGITLEMLRPPQILTVFA